LRSKRRRPRPAKGELFPKLVRSACFILLFIAVAVVFSAVPSMLLSVSLIDANEANFLSIAAISFAFPAAAVAYLLLVERDGKADLMEKLGLSTKGFSIGNVFLGVFVFIIILSLEVLVSVISSALGIDINTNAATIFVGAPLWFYFFTAVISPINEEILFRGLCVPRLGIVLSAVIFGVLHYSYNSTYGIEVIAAIIFGLVSGYVYKRTGSIYPSIMAHIFVNTLTVVSAYSMLIWVLH
jgi:membrane protease YdiL (CAAX protease family)